MLFTENGMRIYDCEVLGVSMQNADVEKMLVNAQREVIQNTLVLAGERRKLDYVKEAEDLKRQAEQARAETQQATLLLAAEHARRKLELDLTVIDANAKTAAELLTKQLDQAKTQAQIDQVSVDHRRDERETQLELDAKAQALKVKEIEANVAAVVEKAKAISPDLVAALSAFGERAMVERVAEAMAPLGILSGGKKSVVEILQELLKGTALSNQLGSVLTEKPNGTARRTPASHA